MPRPVLHRVRVAEHNLYWVGEYPLFLRNDHGGWGIHAAPSRAECKQWIKELGLKGQRFQSRGEALQVLIMALEEEDAPQPDYLPRATRRADGTRQTQDGWILQPTGGGWDVYSPEDVFHTHCKGSLWRALWLVDSINSGKGSEDSWPAHLTHDRTERGVHEGSDRSPKKRVD